MFERRVLKQRAKEVLSLNYWNIFIVIILSNLISSAASGIIALATGAGTVLSESPASTAVYLTLQLASAALSIAVSALLIMPLQVGINKYVLEMSEGGTSNIDRLLYSFRANYTGIATVLFVKTLIITLLTVIPVFIITTASVVLALSENLFTLLIMLVGYVAIIPVIIKTYDYYLVEYILTEKPDLSWREALGESKTLMRGNRFAVFKLNFSFFGWFLLGALACGVGALFVIPYVTATDAQLYRCLSGKTKTEL